MKRFSFLAVLFFCAALLRIDAKEGMWIPKLVEELNYDDLVANGYKLTPEDIYSVNQACLKDAVVIFGGGCTGELISDDGLLLTNHHCGYDQIQQHSTVENNYLKNGFWAKSRSEELPNPDLTVMFLVEIKEYTSTLLNQLPKGLPLDEEQAVLAGLIDSLEYRISDSLKLNASIEKFFEGNQYYLFLYKEYTDIRLVGAPPEAIGNFGGDTDNWVWPRHTGDFSIFRIYADENGEPADFDASNIPYTPKKYLTISAQGIAKNDFTMVLGYPGSTYEYRYSTELEMYESQIYPTAISLRDGRLDIINYHRAQSKQIYIQYAYKQKRIGNSWKKWKGILYGFNRFQVIEERKAYETWLLENAGDKKTELQELYEMFDDAYVGYEPYAYARTYYRESLLILEPVSALNRDLGNAIIGLNNLANKDLAAIKVKEKSRDYFKDYNMQVDKQLTQFVLARFIAEVDDVFKPASLEGISEAGLKKYIDNLYEKSFLVDSVRFNSAIEKLVAGKTSVFDKDPYVILWNELSELYNGEIINNFSYYRAQLKELNKQYIPLITAIDTGRAMYPDANFTMRLAYGKIEGYSPRDALNYHYQTYLDGIIEKGDMGVYDYVVPTKLKDLYDTKNFGRYVDSSGRVPVCFIASNHTSGGNSGSPVMDAEGRLIGINFDRTWEGTMSDYNFDEEICRNISVDIRYVLFVIDKFADSGYLLEEMDIDW